MGVFFTLFMNQASSVPHVESLKLIAVLYSVVHRAVTDYKMEMSKEIIMIVYV